VALAHVYKTLKPLSLKKTIVFVAFGKEEAGLAGSREMAQAIKNEEVNQYCAMINLDSFGLALPQAADNMSSGKMIELAASVSRQMEVKFAHTSIPNAASDSNSFLSRKIPAITLHGLNNEWPKLLHTGNDQVSKVNPASVYLGYGLALAMVGEIDKVSCETFR
jgi:Zn-dependent M28 family amino/carboxypeptidase